MVRIINYVVRESAEGNTYVNLELQGDIVLVQSMNTGRFYATAKKCRITSTFDEQTAKSLIGRELPGRIDRVETEPYEYTVPKAIRNQNNTRIGTLFLQMEYQNPSKYPLKSIICFSPSL